MSSCSLSGDSLRFLILPVPTEELGFPDGWLTEIYRPFFQTSLGLPSSTLSRYVRGGLPLYSGAEVSSPAGEETSRPLLTQTSSFHPRFGDLSSRSLIKDSLAFTRPNFP